MDNKKIIITIIILVILITGVGLALFNTISAKEPVKIEITSNKTLNEGDKLSIKLTNLNNSEMGKEIVNITITDKNGKVVVDEVVKTNSKGNAKIDLKLKKGEYNVTVSYGGNQNYSGNNTTQKLTIKEKVAEAVSSGGSSGGDYLDGPAVDSLGITKEQARHAEQVSGYDVKYDYKSGMYVQYDPYNHCYHN